MATTLPPLVTAADLTQFGYDPSIVTDALIARASARIRGYTRQDITEGTSTVIRRGFSPLPLPQRPVQQVTAVQWLDGVTVDRFTAVGSLLYLHDLATPPGWGDDQFPWPLGRRGRYCQPVTVKVTYDHGYAELPAGLAELVCSVAARMGSGDTAMAGQYKQLTVGAWSATYSREAVQSAGTLLASEETALDGWFPRRRASTVMLP